LRDDSIVEIQGESAGVHKAVELIAVHLRKFLVDRSIVGVFETQASPLFFIKKFVSSKLKDLNSEGVSRFLSSLLAFFCQYCLCFSNVLVFFFYTSFFAYNSLRDFFPCFFQTLDANVRC